MYTTETESRQSKGFLVNNYQNGLVGYFPVILVVGFLFLSRQEESSYRGKDTEGKKMKTHGAEWGAQEGSGRVSMGTSTLTESVWHQGSHRGVKVGDDDDWNASKKEMP